MNERPTPETDAVTMQPVDRLARAYTFHGTKPYKYSTKELVPTEFAKELERARDEAREALLKIEEIYIDGCDTYEDWKAMGDIARAAVEKFVDPSCSSL